MRNRVQLCRTRWLDPCATLSVRACRRGRRCAGSRRGPWRSPAPARSGRSSLPSRASRCPGSPGSGTGYYVIGEAGLSMGSSQSLVRRRACINASSPIWSGDARFVDDSPLSQRLMVTHHCVHCTEAGQNPQNPLVRGRHSMACCEAHLGRVEDQVARAQLQQRRLAPRRQAQRSARLRLHPQPPLGSETPIYAGVCRRDLGSLASTTVPVSLFPKPFQTCKL